MHLAGKLELPVVVVEHSGELISLGGVGCLLRTRIDTQTNQYTTAAVATAEGRRHVCNLQRPGVAFQKYPEADRQDP